MRNKIHLLCMVVLCSLCDTFLAKANCHLSPNFDKTQYVLAYGSLMSQKSKKREGGNLNRSYPVIVNGFERGWYVRSEYSYFDASYLAAIPKGSSSKMYASIFKIDDPKVIIYFDKREKGYCRRRIHMRNLHSLTSKVLDRHAEVWIYLVDEDQIKLPDKDHPIVQSYVDLFISGCLDLQGQFSLKNFARNCIVTTKGWAEHWVNDRIYPRRPLIYEPNARKIDFLLKNTIPSYFAKVK